MDGNNGYCSKLLGTTIYKTAMESWKNVLDDSQCHTLDRNNLRAQRDSCGLNDADKLDKAVELLFNINHWPLVQGTSSTSCIKSLFGDSLQNQQKMMAILGRSLSMIASVFLAMCLLF